MAKEPKTAKTAAEAGSPSRSRDGAPQGAGGASSPEKVTASQAPVPPATKPADALSIKTKNGKTRWRAGREFGAAPKIVPLAELTPEETRALRGDPQLAIELVKV